MVAPAANWRKSVDGSHVRRCLFYLILVARLGPPGFIFVQWARALGRVEVGPWIQREVQDFRLGGQLWTAGAL